MRTLLAGEFDLAAGRETDVYLKLEVQNGSGTWIDVGALLGKHWIINATWGEHVDAKVSQATFTLIQQIGNDSLAPLMEASALNVDDTSAYSPLLDVGRLVRASTATMGHNVTLDTAKYRRIFDGRIDDVIQNDEYGQWVGPIAIQCSDLGAWLMDLQIESPGKQYGDPDSPPNLEDVLQDVIDDNLPAGDPAVTLVKTSTSNFAVTDYPQGDAKVMEALTNLVLDSVGEDIRYRYNSSHVSTLQWFDPDRSRSSVDGTFTKRQYILRRLSLSIADIRNAGAMPFTDEESGVTDVVTAESLPSIDKYRRRYFRLAGSSMLTTRDETQRALNRVVNDLEAPPAEAEAELAYCWFVQLFDRYTFASNNRQYDQDQTFSVVAYQHSIEANRASTTLTLTARIVGAYAEWLKRIRAGSAVFLSASIDRISTQDSETERTFTLTIGSRVETVHVHYRTVPADVAGDPFDFSGNETVTEPVTTTILNRDIATDTVSFSVPLPPSGYRVCGRAIPYTVGLPDPIEGAGWVFSIDPSPLDAPAQGTVSISSNGAWEATGDGPSNALSFRWSSSTSGYPADATVQAGGTLVSGTGRFLAISGGAALSFGDTVYVTIIPFDGAGGTGNALPSIHLRGAYQTFTASKTTTYDPSNWKPAGSSDVAFMNVGSAAGTQGWAENAALTAPGLVGPAMFPVIANNVTITAIEIDGYDGTIGLTTHAVVFARNSGTTLTAIGSVGFTPGGGSQTQSASLSESTTARSYRLAAVWQTDAITNEAAGAFRLGPVRITTTQANPSTSV